MMPEAMRVFRIARMAYNSAHNEVGRRSDGEPLANVFAMKDMEKVLSEALRRQLKFYAFSMRVFDA